MFAKLLSNLFEETPDPLTVEDARLALAAVMVRVARADGHYAQAEVAQITEILKERYALDEDAAMALRAEAETLESEAPDTVRFTKAIKDAVPYEDRFGVVVSLWRVALADGARDYEENAQMRLLANLLGVNDRDSALARQKAST